MKKVTQLAEQIDTKKYDVYLDIDDQKLEFKGKTKLEAKPKKDLKQITLHSKDLAITEVSVNGAAAKFSLDEDDDLLVINHSASKNEELLIETSFSAKITEQMHGIYPGYYKDGNEDKMIISTQLESHHARSAFPCIDEPSAKAVFQATLRARNGQVVLSNTPIKSEDKAKTHTEYSFEDTPKMSTYLFAFAIGELEYLEAKSKKGVLVRSYATKDLVKHTKFALDVATKTIDYFSDYFDIDYPLEKCDFVAIPNFSAGAMENWGLITFREAAFLVDPENTTLGSKQFVAEVVAHELAHMWFGNLVTMQWWTDLWLNEGFASWIANYAVDVLFPKWKFWSQFVVHDFILAQNLDSLENSHPIEVEIKHPDEIRSIFDGITYSKGAVVIRMLHDYLGPDDFRDGLREYLKKYQYSNAKTADLWQSLEEVSKKPVADLMSSWTSQMGFPVVHAEIKDSSIELSQERYTVNPEADRSGSLWKVPVISTHTEDRYLLEKTEESWSTTTSAQTIKLNTGQAGFFMVAYDRDSYEKLNKALDTGKLNELDRLGLINDTFQLAKGGYVNTTQALELVKEMNGEQSAVVWDVIASQLSAVRKVVGTEDIIDAMRPYARDLSKKQVGRLGWQENDTDTHDDLMLRPLALSLASFGDDPKVTDEALRRFKDAKSPEDIPPDLRGVVYSTAVRHGGQDEFNKLYGFFKETKSPQEKQSLSAALTGFEDEAIIKQALDLIRSEVKLQDVGYWVAYSFVNRHSKKQAWQWVQDNWNWLEKNFKNDISTLSLIPKHAASAFATHEFLDEYNQFFKEHELPGIKRAIAQGKESIIWHSAWRERDASSIEKYFS